MTLQVVSSKPPYVQVTVTIQGEAEPVYTGQALLGTCYDGSLSLPSTAIGSRQAVGEWEIELADNSRFYVPYFSGSINIAGLAHMGVVLSVLGSEAIVGRRVMDYFRVTFDHGREVTVEP